MPDDHSKITVQWDYDPPADKALANTTFEVSFLAKDTQAVFIPTPATTAAGTMTLEITPAANTHPTAEELGTNYSAQVIAKGDASHANSPAGLQVYWVIGLSLIVVVGGHSFTLTKPTGTGRGGVYRLPVSRTNPFTLTLEDVQEFADALHIGRDKVPTHWPNGAAITSGLSLYKLAVDTDNKLFALDIAFTVEFEPVPGLTIQEVGLSVLRTDGVHSL